MRLKLLPVLTATIAGWLWLSASAYAGAADKRLDVFFIDTEGGAATLIVTPLGESLLADAGNPGERDPGRIHHVAVKIAGLKQIDHHLVTHWHTDHYGGTPHLAELIPIKRFYDHGIPDADFIEAAAADYPKLMGAYRKATGGRSTVLRPGDEIALRSDTSARVAPLGVRVLVAAGQTVHDAPGAAANPLCSSAKPQPPDTSDNHRSIGFLLSFGPFKFLDLGDLTWNVEQKLVCPTNKIGMIDVYQVTHHGLAQSNNPVLVHSVAPRVAIMNNGPRKGGELLVIQTLRTSPGMEAIYQLHRNVQTSDADNVPPEFIANLDEKCQGEFIKLSVEPDGQTYTVTVGSKGTPRSYKTR